MSIDRNNRSHRPKGLPPQVAGTYEPAAPGMDTTDVTPPDPDGPELDRLEREAAALPAPGPGDIAWMLDGHPIPQTVIDRCYGTDDIRLQRLVILSHADPATRRELAAHRDDHEWVRAHATPLYEDRACIIVFGPRPVGRRRHGSHGTRGRARGGGAAHPRRARLAAPDRHGTSQG